MKRNILIVLVLLVSLVVGIVAWPEELTEEERIEQVIIDIRDGIEQEILADVMEGFSPDYKDDSGGSYDMIRGLFMRQFLKSEPITIQLSPIRVDVEENIAEANFDAAIFEGEGVSIFAIPNKSDVLNFNVLLTKDFEGEWKITSHTREFTVEQ